MNHRITHTLPRQTGAFLLALFFGLMSAKAAAVDLDLSDIPLAVKEGVPANIILTMDDSGSMAWGFLPDDRSSNRKTLRYSSYVWNKIFYNPTVTYLPGVDKSGVSLPNSSFTAAWYNGYSTVTGTRNLSTLFQPLYYDYRPTSGSVSYVPVYSPATAGTSCNPVAPTTSGCYDPIGVPAYYYIFDESKTTGAVACDFNNATHTDTTDDCYTKVVVSSTSGVNVYDPVGTACTTVDTDNTACYTTGTDERQNFANWFSYYRIRHLLAKTATSRAFSGLSTSIRVAWQELNGLTNIGDTLPFDGTHRTDFFTWLYGARTGGGTPLTNAMQRAGAKFSTDSVYRLDPTNANSPLLSCRQNFHFAFTDGYWNSNSVSAPGNYDNQGNLTLPTTGTSKYGDINYSAQTTLTADSTPPIYRDGNSNYLGDIAMYYWARDLRPALTNNVPLFIPDQTTDLDGDGDVDNFDIFWNPANDPAEWQHMVNFTVGLGIDGVLSFDGTTTSGTTYTNLLNGTTTWANNHVDDLWHAAINSRGGYFNASNPVKLLTSFQGVLDAIDERKASSSSVATTSSQYQTGTLVFQATYDPSKWTGDVVARDVISLAQQWSAATQIDFQIGGTGRNLITFDPASLPNGKGVAFRWANLNTTQQTALDTLNAVNDGKGSLRLDYLRGDSSQETNNGGTFRNRSTVLGDVVHSDPVFVPPPGPPLFFYKDNLETVAYSSFVASNNGRKNMLLFGSNDGALHIHDADNGIELLAYVPSMVYNNLSSLTDPLYQHQFYVDQPISFWDVFYGSNWHTVAIGGLGKGGQGIYALDITDPTLLVEANAINVAMWEFSDADDADLGYSYTKPSIMKMNNGKWMVAFGNGYNSTEADGNASTTGDAILFLLDVEHGGKGGAGLKVKLSTENGTAEDPTATGRANRLTDIIAIDKNNDQLVDYIYAGDMFGNLWKFDVSDSNANNWSIIKQGTTPKPLFVATDANGDRQPITIGPAIQFHQKKNGYMIYFGTGKYVENGDPFDLSLNTFYGVWDREESNITTIGRAHLLEQQMLGENTSQFASTDARLTTANNLSWYTGSGTPSGNPVTRYLGWYINLANIDNTQNPILRGERLDGDVYVFGNRVEFQTLIPDSDVCTGGGTSWIFALNATTGSRFLTSTPWDYNTDGNFGDLDKVNWGGGSNQVWGSGITLKNRPMFRRTRLLNPSECQEISVLNSSDGTLSTVRGSCSSKEVGRRSWRQLLIKAP